MTTYELTKADLIRKERNNDRYGWDDVCCICGKPMKHVGVGKSIMLHLMPSGMLVDDREDEITEIRQEAEMGYFECGSDCYRRFKKEGVEMTKEEILAKEA